MNYVDLRYTKDGGRTWSDWRKIELGDVGDFVKRVVARRFGSSRQFVFQERVTDDCRADLIAASIQIEPAGP
jgi:hypothetical protein